MTTTRYFDQRERYTENPEVFTYDVLPTDLRWKIAYLFEDLHKTLRDNLNYPQTLLDDLWRRKVVRGLGIPQPPQSVTAHLVKSEVSPFFIGVEVFLESAAITALNVGYRRDESKQALFATIAAANKLFLYYGLGYEIIQAPADDDVPLFQVIRKDNQYTHAEMTKPALALLTTEGFEHAQKQFLDAHREFQVGHYDDAITDAEAAVESVLKVVLGVEEGNAKDLLKRSADEGYFPAYMQDSTNQWVNLFLELPATRNRFGDAHGKGKDKPSDAEMERLARLALNLAATHILFVMDEFYKRPTRMT